MVIYLAHAFFCLHKILISSSSSSSSFFIYLRIFLPLLLTQKNNTICDYDGCNKPGRKFCTVCRTPYCSRECQKSAWKSHKVVCQQKAAGELSANDLARPCVVVSPSDVEANYGDSEHVVWTLNMNGGASSMGKGRSVVMIPYMGKIIVKVQGPIFGGGHLLIYPEGKVFLLGGISDTKEPGRSIRRFCESLGPLPYPGQSPHPATAKVFLHAVTVTDGIKVFLDKPAPFQRW